MISAVENLLLNETENTKSSYLMITSKLKEHGIVLDKSNESLMFANHLLMLIKRLEEDTSTPEYYFDDENEVKTVGRNSLAIAEYSLYDVFVKYDVSMSYTEMILCAMYIELIQRREVNG